MSRHQLAQINVARLLAPIDAPETADFVAALEPVNARADAAPGFVWRLQTESGDATAVQAFDDPLVIVNLTVWESVEALEAFAYRDEARTSPCCGGGASGSSGTPRRRRPSGGSPAGHIPTVDEALDRLATLRARRALTAGIHVSRALPGACERGSIRRRELPGV